MKIHGYNHLCPSGLYREVVLIKDGLFRLYIIILLLLMSYSFLAMQQQGQSKNGTEFQRPETISKMLPIRITLHEEIMLESWTTNPPFDIRINREQLYSNDIIIMCNLINQSVLFDKPVSST